MAIPSQELQRGSDRLEAALHAFASRRRSVEQRPSGVRCERAGSSLLYLIVDGGLSGDVASEVRSLARGLEMGVWVERVESSAETGRDVFAVRPSSRAAFS